MSQKHFLLKGTFILTVVGILTRVMGFFYRIFLGRLFPCRRNRSVSADFPCLTHLLMLQLQQGSRRLWRAWLPPLLQKSSLQKLILT